MALKFTLQADVVFVAGHKVRVFSPLVEDGAVTAIVKESAAEGVLTLLLEGHSSRSIDLYLTGESATGVRFTVEFGQMKMAFQNPAMTVWYSLDQSKSE